MSSAVLTFFILLGIFVVIGFGCIALFPNNITPPDNDQANSAVNSDTNMVNETDTSSRGPKPMESAWDGETKEVDHFLKASLNDYESLKVIECSPVVEWKDYAWAQRVKFRAKNAFGAYILDECIFVIKNGKVIDVQPY